MKRIPSWLPAAVALCLVMVSRPEAAHIRVQYAQPAGLSKGDRVLFENKEAGRVGAIESRSAGRWVVGLHLHDTVTHALTEHARFHVIEDPQRPGRKAVQLKVDGAGGARLAEGATVDGVAPVENGSAPAEQELEKALEALERQVQKYARGLQKLTESEEYRRMKKKLGQMTADMERAGEEVREKMESRWLPAIQRELEALRKWWRSQSSGKEAPPEGEGGTIYL